MDKKTVLFLNEQLVPNYVRLLLELYGITFIEELSKLDYQDIEEIEQGVRSGSFGGHVDFTSKANRMKYLGFDVSDVSKFSFRPIVKKKLLAISAAATLAAAKKTEELKKPM